MGLVLAAASALFYGTADFLGGLAARTVVASRVALVSQALGLVALAAVVAVWPSSDPVQADFLWGALGGVGGGVGLAVFYRALAVGPMSVVAPLTAVSSAVVPVLAGVAQGERPALASWLGVASAIPAIALVTRSEGSGGQQVSLSSVVTALGAGLAFGLFFVAFGQTRPEAELWPLVAARFASISVLGSAELVRRARLDEPDEPLSRRALVTIGGAGVFDTTANAFYLLATHAELLSLAAIVASLYPVSTVALARTVLAERFGRAQVVGMTVAALAVVLVAAGR